MQGEYGKEHEEQQEYMVKHRGGAQHRVSHVESCLTKKDLPRVRSLMKHEVSDKAHLQVCHLTPQQVRLVHQESTHAKTDEIFAPTSIVEEMNSIQKDLDCKIAVQ